MSLPNFFKTGARVALVALALGGTAITAMPAQAAGPSFSIQFGNSDFDHYQGGKWKKNHDHFKWDVNAIQWKLSQTYKSVQYKQQWKGTYIFVGRKGSTWYELRVDAKTGHVWAIPVKQKKGGGFNLTFNF